MQKIIPLILAVVIGGTAQTPQKPQSPSTQEDIVRVTTSLIQTDVVVTDKNDQVINDLTLADFKLLENGKKQDLQFMEFVKSSRSEEHTSELQSRSDLVCRLLLEKKISPSESILRSGEISTLTTTVSNASAPVSGATLALASSGGTFTQPVMTMPGVYVSNFTAPSVTSSTTTLITVTANKSGFSGNSGQTSITVNPLPTLTVAVTPRPTTISPGGNIVLDIKVLNGTESVSGATINITSSGGGGFSTPVDKGNGNYTAMFNAPTQNSSPTITIQATKPGFVAGQNQVTVVISGVPDLTSIKVGGIPLIIFLASFILIAVIMIVAVAQRRKNDRSQHYN